MSLPPSVSPSICLRDETWYDAPQLINGIKNNLIFSDGSERSAKTIIVLAVCNSVMLAWWPHWQAKIRLQSVHIVSRWHRSLRLRNCLGITQWTSLNGGPDWSPLSGPPLMLVQWVIDRVKWRHISMVAIRSPFCRSSSAKYFLLGHHFLSKIALIRTFS